MASGNHDVQIPSWSSAGWVRGGSFGLSDASAERETERNIEGRCQGGMRLSGVRRLWWVDALVELLVLDLVVSHPRPVLRSHPCPDADGGLSQGGSLDLDQ